MIGVVESPHIPDLISDNIAINFEGERVSKRFHCELASIDKTYRFAKGHIGIDTCLHTIAIRVYRYKEQLITETYLATGVAITQINLQIFNKNAPIWRFNTDSHLRSRMIGQLGGKGKHHLIVSITANVSAIGIV